MINVFLNGCFMPVHEATVSIEDRGLLFGDGVYDYIRIYDQGKPFQLREHLERFFQNASALTIPMEYTLEELEAISWDLVTRSGIQRGNIYIQLTRGAASPRTHYFPREIHPNLFLIVREMGPELPKVMEEGLQAILLPDERWSRCDIKTVNLLPNILGKEKAVSQGAFECIFYRKYGITEGASHSVFVIKDDRLSTTPQGSWILPGITCRTVISIAEASGRSVYREFTMKENIYKADEVFVTSTSGDIVPITRIDGQPIGSGKPGPVTVALKKAFLDIAREANVLAKPVREA